MSCICKMYLKKSYSITQYKIIGWDHLSRGYPMIVSQQLSNFHVLQQKTAGCQELLIHKVYTSPWKTSQSAIKLSSIGTVMPSRHHRPLSRAPFTESQLIECYIIHKPQKSTKILRSFNGAGWWLATRAQCTKEHRSPPTTSREKKKDANSQNSIKD